MAWKQRHVICCYIFNTAVMLFEFMIACVNRTWPLRLHSQLEERVRDMLNSAKDDPNEMFRVCAKFNALFVRPNIQVWKSNWVC